MTRLQNGERRALLDTWTFGNRHSIPLASSNAPSLGFLSRRVDEEL